MQGQTRSTHLEILIGKGAPSRSSLLADIVDALGDIGRVVILHRQGFQRMI